MAPIRLDTWLDTSRYRKSAVRNLIDDVWPCPASLRCLRNYHYAVPSDHLRPSTIINRVAIVCHFTLQSLANTTWGIRGWWKRRIYTAWLLGRLFSPCSGVHCLSEQYIQVLPGKCCTLILHLIPILASRLSNQQKFACQDMPRVTICRQMSLPCIILPLLIMIPLWLWHLKITSLQASQPFLAVIRRFQF